MSTKETTFYCVGLPNPEFDEVHVTTGLTVGNTGSIALATVFATNVKNGSTPLYKSGERFFAISELAFYYSNTVTARTIDETATTGVTRCMLWPANTPLPFHIVHPSAVSSATGASDAALQLNYKATGTQRIRICRASDANMA
jgi:hypothetical protein